MRLRALVALRAVRGMGAGVEVAEIPEAIDPVCGMTVDIDSAKFRAEHDGEAFYFCAAGCRRAFEADPGQFLNEVGTR